MRQFKIKYTRYITPAEYKSTSEYQEALNKIQLWKQGRDNSNTLDLSNLKLKWLPRLPNNLQKLYCEHNQLTSLPDLPNTLQVLWCSNNKLTSLPMLPNTLHELDCGRK